jgi:cob(I)alamin adenosyltransferase
VGHRLSKIYTRTGDSGETGLGDGSRVAKDEPRIEAIGSIDELNSVLGVLLSRALPARLNERLTSIQHRLFDLGGELSVPGYDLIKSSDVDDLEHWLDELNTDLPMLKEFILPGGSEAAAFCHLARSLCRRAERRLVTLAGTQPVNAAALRYLNRLSDFLFVAARDINRSEQHPEITWQRR